MHKLIQVLTARELCLQLFGRIEVNDTCLGDVRSGEPVDRASLQPLDWRILQLLIHQNWA